MNATAAYGVKTASTALGPLTIDRRTPREQDVQIEILYCGVCHSDIHTAKNEWGGTKYPCVPGHEIVGRIAAIGAAVTTFKVGDLAGVGCLVDSCRECQNCKEGLQQYCENGIVGTYNGKTTDGTPHTMGGYSKSIVVDASFVLRISDKLPLEAVAPLLCAGITTYSPLRHWKVGKGHKIGVLGLGGLGHMAVKLAASFGAEVTMISQSPSKEVDAMRLGASHFLLSTDTAAMAKAFRSFDFILNTVSAPHDYNTYLQLLKTNGTMICVGAPIEPAKIPAFSLIGQRRSLVGSLIGGIPETQEMLDYCAEKGIVSEVEVIPMSAINEAYERMLKGDVKYRFVVDMATL